MFSTQLGSTAQSINGKMRAIHRLIWKTKQVAGNTNVSNSVAQTHERSHTKPTSCSSLKKKQTTIFYKAQNTTMSKQTRLCTPGPVRFSQAPIPAGFRVFFLVSYCSTTCFLRFLHVTLYRLISTRYVPGTSDASFHERLSRLDDDCLLYTCTRLDSLLQGTNKSDTDTAV